MTPRHSEPTPAPLASLLTECCEAGRAGRSVRLSVTRARGSDAARTAFLYYGVTNPQNPQNVSVTPLPLNFRSFAGSRTRICSSLDMFLAGEVTLGSGGQLTAARSIRTFTESLRERGAGVRGALPHVYARGGLCCCASSRCSYVITLRRLQRPYTCEQKPLIKVMLEKMEAKGQRSVKGGQKGRKRPVQGSDGDGKKKPRLDGTTVSYFRRVSDRLKEGFTEEEEKGVFVHNVLSEVKGKAALVAMDMTGSLVLEKLLPLAGPAQVADVLAELGGDTGSEFTGVACDQCGGHVMQSAVRQARRWTEEASDVTEAGEEHCGMLEAQVQRLCGVVRENIVRFAKDPYGSHVLRTLVQVLSGCLTPEAPGAPKAKKNRICEGEMMDFEIPTSFWWELKHLADCLMENINVCVSNTSACAALQILLTVCHRKRPILCKKLNKGIMGYLTSLSSAPGVSPLLVFMKDPSDSHLLQTVFKFSHKALLRDVYRNHLRSQLMPLVLHPIAHFPVQSLIAASAPFRLFLKIFDELMEGFEAILAAGNLGLVVQMVESCARWEERQSELLQRLLQAFHCSEPATLQVSCLPLFLSFLAYEVYYHTKPAEGDAVTQSSQQALSVCYHGSRLVQALAGFKDRSVLMNSLHELSSANLLTLGTDPMGSRALQALVTSGSDKGRGKILRKMQDMYVDLACSACGSRLLEAVWSSATVSQRQSIAERLAPSESRLRSHQFARHIWAKFGLTSFLKRRGDWLEAQTGDSKKRKMFRDILE
ncbi:Nucleolar protein 9 [Anabarilius grahami]|uniref:Nucleolar protein 9 n=1 Tax=Anabarilius grahami TaxID=495550 RepID=A0A3N0YZS8_ANAGA|nr:Nucleolar protein 9 [Anabarilius grahami]